MSDTIHINGAEYSLPCVITGMAHAGYLGIKAMSASGIGNVIQSPATHYHGGETFDVDAAAKGTALHWAIGQPEEYERYVAFDPYKEDGNHVSRNSNAYKIARARHMIDTDGAGVMLKAKDHEHVQAMADAIWDYEWLPPELGDKPMLVEAVILWRDPRTGLLCKCKPDLWWRSTLEAARLMIDLKTCHTDVSAHAWGRHSFEHRYHITEAWYRRGALALGEPLCQERYKFLCVSKRDTPQVGLYCHTAMQLERANHVIDETLALWRWCEETGKYPRNHRPGKTEHPPWAGKAHEETLVKLRDFRERVAPESFSGIELEEMSYE